MQKSAFYPALLLNWSESEKKTLVTICDPSYSYKLTSALLVKLLTAFWV